MKAEVSVVSYMGMVIKALSIGMLTTFSELPRLLMFNDIFAILSSRSRSCRPSHPHASSLVWSTGIDLGDNSSETTRDYGVAV